MITPVSMDHTEFLGDTLTTIAGEKAGIIKRGVPVISRRAGAGGDGRHRGAGAGACARRCMRAGQEWHVSVERGRLVYQDDRGLMDLAAPKLFGRHQFDNAGLAIATLRAHRCVQDRHRRVRGRHRQCRMAGADAAPGVGRAGGSGARRAREVWLDGGHNAEGGRVVAAALGDLEERVSRPLVVIVGMMANKDAERVSRQFRRPDPAHHRGADSGSATTRCRRTGWPTPRAQLGMRVETAASVERRCARWRGLAYEVPPRILITGSLYLAGHVLAANGTPPG